MKNNTLNRLHLNYSMPLSNTKKASNLNEYSYLCYLDSGIIIHEYLYIIIYIINIECKHNELLISIKFITYSYSLWRKTQCSILILISDRHTIII